MTTEVVRVKHSPILPGDNGSPVIIGSLPQKYLFTYAVLLSIDGDYYVKYGDHRCSTIKQLFDYIARDTLGKYRGVFKEESIIGYWDMTSHATRIDPKFDPNIKNYRKGYDNQIRGLMPIKKKYFKNIFGRRSLELHPVPKHRFLNPNWKEDLTHEFNETHNRTLDPSYQPILKRYIGRPYLLDSFSKVTSSSKHLLAAATGAGKEASTIALLIHIHNIKKYGNYKLNVAVATIPSTISELLTELATVSGISVGNDFIDFSSIKPYITRQWYNKYASSCNLETRMFIHSNKVSIVDQVSDIPIYHTDDVVPVLFGSYHDIALKSGKRLHTRYTGLADRIGTFSIGEAHQMLSKSNNKMWDNLNKELGKDCFKLFITATPYDFVYNAVAAEFFGATERSMFTRNDLETDKRTNPLSEFRDYPDFKFYGLDVAGLVDQLKLDEHWIDDAFGFTWKKFFEYTDSKFRYESSIIWLFKQMFGSTFYSEDGCPLSLYNAPELCDLAKRHIMVALPSGKKDASASVYIKALKALLIKHKVFQGEIFDAYADDLGDRKNEIENAQGRTLTLTCIKDCTGANIPALGSFVFLRNIGNSVKFFEQSIGRVGRVFPGKTNCGVFIGDLEATINIMLAVEEKISIERGNTAGSKAIMSEMLANYSFFYADNGKWSTINMVNFADTIEKLSAQGNYGVKQCINVTSAPVDFILTYNNKVSTVNTVVDIISNNNEGAKTASRTVTNTQPPLSMPQVSSNIDEIAKLNWNNMKLSFVAKCRLLAFVHGAVSVYECSDIVQNAIDDNDTDILSFIGKGVEYFPEVIINSRELDIPYTNRWIQKLNDVKHDSEKLLKLFEDSIYRTEDSFVAEPYDLIRDVTSKTLSSLVEKGHNLFDLSFFDPCAGRGSFLIALFDIAKELNHEIDPAKVYYNDIDTKWVSFFKAINVQLSLDIPAENISAVDLISSNFDKSFDVIITNPPFSNIDTSRDETKHRGQGINLAKQCTQKILELSNVSSVVIMPYGERTYSRNLRALYKNKGLYKIEPCFEYFTSIASNPCIFHFDRTTTVILVDDQYYNHDHDVPYENIGDIFVCQPGSIDRCDYEHKLVDTGKYEVVVTTSITKFTDDDDIINQLNDKTIGSWRVVFNCTTDHKKIGKIIVVAPYVSLGKSVNCLITPSKDYAFKLKDYLESPQVKQKMKEIKTVNKSNSKKFLKHIELPF